MVASSRIFLNEALELLQFRNLESDGTTSIHVLTNIKNSQHRSAFYGYKWKETRFFRIPVLFGSNCENLIYLHIFTTTVHHYASAFKTSTFSVCSYGEHLICLHFSSYGSGRSHEGRCSCSSFSHRKNNISFLAALMHLSQQATYGITFAVFSSS